MKRPVTACRFIVFFARINFRVETTHLAQGLAPVSS
jgi:hypothetical protein